MGPGSRTRTQPPGGRGPARVPASGPPEQQGCWEGHRSQKLDLTRGPGSWGPATGLRRGTNSAGPFTAQLGPG